MLRRERSGWVSGDPGILAKRVDEGWLSPEDEREIEDALDLVLAAVQAGTISGRFGNWIIRTLATEKASRWRETR